MMKMEKEKLNLISKNDRVLRNPHICSFKTTKIKRKFEGYLSKKIETRNSKMEWLVCLASFL